MNNFPAQRMTFDSMVQSLGLDDRADVWRSTWDLSSSSSGDARLAALDQSFLRDICAWLDVAQEVRSELLEAAALIRDNDALRRLLWHCYWMFFLRDLSAKPQAAWAMLPKHLGAAARLFNAIMYLSGVPLLRQRNKDRGISDEITRATLKDMELWIRHHHQHHGEWALSNFDWLTWHFSGRLFALGRLQFQLDFFPPPDHVVRESDRSVRVQAECQDGSTVCVAPGDPVLAVHIPATGPMDHSACGESFAQAMEFFPRHFPEHNFRAFTCDSWLLDEQLADYLPGESNIVRFQREFLVYPLPRSDQQSTLERVLGTCDIDRAPRKTLLQRAVVQHVRSGKQWRTAGGIILREDLAWGKQVYRTKTNQ